MERVILSGVWHRLHRVALAALLVLTAAPPLVVPSFAAQGTQETRKLVEASRHTLESFVGDPNYAEFSRLLRRAKGVLIVPQKVKGAFIVGAKGGSGVLLTRDAETGSWNGPAFYTLGGVSYGLQAGGAVSEVVLLIMTDKGVSTLMASSIKLGANVSIAAGPVGGGVSAETANLSADILSFARSKGLYGGVSLQGAIVAVRSGMNRDYYGKSVNSADILFVKSVSNPHSSELLNLLQKTAGEKE